MCSGGGGDDHQGERGRYKERGHSKSRRKKSLRRLTPRKGGGKKKEAKARVGGKKVIEINPLATIHFQILYSLCILFFLLLCY